MTIVLLSDQTAIVTADGHVVSGDLDVQLGRDHRGMVRHRGDRTWSAIGNTAGEPPRTWPSLAALAAAIKRNVGERDRLGNLIAFEC